MIEALEENLTTTARLRQDEVSEHEAGEGRERSPERAP